MSHFPDLSLQRAKPRTPAEQFPPYQPAGTCRVEDYEPHPELEMALTLWANALMIRVIKRKERGILVLGVPGSGKTTTVADHLSRLGFHVIEIGAASLEDESAGAPVKLLDEIFAGAERLSKATGKRVVILIDDIDGVLSQPPLVQVTVNKQLLEVRLQRILNAFDQYFNHDGTPIGVAMTANSTEHMRSSIHRDMRVSTFVLEPDHAFKTKAACRSLGAKTDEERAIVADMVADHADRAPAFFFALGGDLEKQRLATALERFSTIEEIEAELAKPFPLDRATVMALAAARAASKSRQNFLVPEVAS